MAKFHGMVGFATQSETSPGVWKDVRITEVEYFGEVLSNSFGNQPEGEVNDDLRLNDRISIICNTYAIENLQFMRYVTYMGLKWRITNIDPQYPRLILTIGGVWNGQSA